MNNILKQRLAEATSTIERAKYPVKLELVFNFLKPSDPLLRITVVGLPRDAKTDTWSVEDFLTLEQIEAAPRVNLLLAKIKDMTREVAAHV